MNKVERCCDEICVKSDLNKIGFIILVSLSLTMTQSRKSGRLSLNHGNHNANSLFKGCARNFMNGRKKPGVKNFSVLLDLIKHCYALLTKAKGLVKDNPSAACAFCDINCSLPRFSQAILKSVILTSNSNRVLKLDLIYIYIYIYIYTHITKQLKFICSRVF